MARRRALSGAFFFVVSLVIAIPALADYLGPNRTVTTWVMRRLHCHYAAVYDPPGSGYYGCGLDLYYAPDASCPSTGDVIGYFSPADCGWPSNFCSSPGCDIRGSSAVEACSEGDTGCRAVSQTVTHPPATISGSVSCATAGSDGWCRGGASLLLSGSEPLAGYEILALEGTRNGEGFACPGASCSVGLVEGGNDLVFWALSSWGDSSLMGTASGRLDSEPPAISGGLTGTPGDAGWYVSDVIVSANASDPMSGVASFESALDSGGWAAYGGPITLTDGVHIIEFRAADVAGNVSTYSQAVAVDAQPPAIVVGLTGEAGEGGWYVSPVSVGASASDTLSGAGSLEVALDGGAWAPYDGPFTLADGTHTADLRAADAAGNVGALSQSVLVDTQGPALALSANASFRPACAETLDISLLVQDPLSGVTAWSLTADGTLVVSGSESFADSITWDGSGMLLGMHRLVLEAQDAAGNRSEAGQDVSLVAAPPGPPPARRQPTAVPSRPPVTGNVATTPTRQAAGVGIAPPTYAPGRQPTRAASTFLFGGPPLAPAPGEAQAGLAGTEPATEGGSSGVLWGAGAAALIASAMAIVLGAARRRQEEEARERAKMESRNAIAEAREVTQSAVRAITAALGGGGSKKRAAPRPASPADVPTGSEAAHNRGVSRRMERLDVIQAAETQTLRLEARQAVEEAHRAAAADSSTPERILRPSTLAAGEWHSLSTGEQAGIVEQAERDRWAEIRAAAAAAMARVARAASPARRNADKAEDEAERWRLSLAGASPRRGQLTSDDLASALAWEEQRREAWRNEVRALSAGPGSDFRLASLDRGITDPRQAREEWLRWQASVRALAELPPPSMADLLGGRPIAPLGDDDMAALHSLLLEPAYTTSRPTLSTWRMAGDLTGRGLEALAMGLLNITARERDMVGGVGLAETRSVGPAGMLVFDMTYYNRVIDTDNPYWAGLDAATRGFAQIGSAYDLDSATEGRVFAGRDYAHYLEDSLAGTTRQNRQLLFTNGRWWDPQARWAFTHRAAAVAAQDLGWRVVAGYRMAELLGEDVAFFLNDDQSAWWEYQEALMDAEVVHYETTSEMAERYEESVRRSWLEANPRRAESPEALEADLEEYMSGIHIPSFSDANTLDGVSEIARTIHAYGNQYASNPSGQDVREFLVVEGAPAYQGMPAEGRAIVRRIAGLAYNHAKFMEAAALDAGAASLVDPAEYRDHSNSLVLLHNTASGPQSPGCASYTWSTDDVSNRVEYGTPRQQTSSGGGR